MPSITVILRRLLLLILLLLMRLETTMLLHPAGALATARLNGQHAGFAINNTVDFSVSDLWDLEMQLDSAIQRGEMVMHYQPKVRLSDLRPIGAEALMRWNSSSRGPVSPDVFIPTAERTVEEEGR